MKKLFYLILITFFVCSSSGFAMDLGDSYEERESLGPIRKPSCRRAALEARKKTQDIYGSAKRWSVKTNDYRINLVWVGKNCNSEFRYIFPVKDAAEAYEKFLNPAFSWAKLNPKTIIQVWYDSEMTTPQAIDETRKLIEAKSSQIVLRDLRTLAKVREHEAAFSAEVPVYFRADLLRLIVSINDIEEERVKYSVYADFDVVPLEKKLIFDQQTIDGIDEHQIVFAKWLWNDENFFHIITEKNKNKLDAIKFVLIDLMIHKAENKELVCADEIVYYINPMHCLVDYLEGNAPLFIKDSPYRFVGKFEKTAEGSITDEIKEAFKKAISPKNYSNSVSDSEESGGLIPAGGFKLIKRSKAFRKKIAMRELHSAHGTGSYDTNQDFYADTWY